MKSRSMPAPKRASISPFGYPEDKVVAYEAVAITQYESGTRRASHARLDVTTKRMIFTQLSNPSEDYTCPYGIKHWLADAAAEALDDAHQQEVLF